MRILIADEFSKPHLESLRGLGLTVDYQPQAKADELPALVRDASMLVVRSTEVKKAVFEAARALSLVVRAGAGVNTIDVLAASARGVYVANCPGQNAIAVAELTMGLMLAVDRRIPDNVQALREGRWDKKRFSEAKGLLGRTLGILGVGAIGTAVAARAKAFGMRVVGCSLDFTPQVARGARLRARRDAARAGAAERRADGAPARRRGHQGAGVARGAGGAARRSDVDQHRAGRGDRPDGADGRGEGRAAHGGARRARRRAQGRARRRG